MHRRHEAVPHVEALRVAHGDALLGWAINRFADRRDAEEVVADTLVRAWQHQDQFDPTRGSERSWLFGIARNSAADHHRRSERHLRTVPTALPDDQAVADDADDIELLVESSYVRNAVQALSAEHRAAILDAYYRGHTANQIAHRQGIAAGTAKSRLHYALKALRADLEENGVL
ncbi:MAG: sigma-70 family RNA polymerase sigma factor [Ilumatobacter sp.]|uniref:sigma-70 family RNA polymerase sigma factor n=1 Tax=Ilumatobacter sp. TaxID=1967498 RepID=UPI003C7202BF